MKKAMVVRVGKGIGRALIEALIGAGVDVVAYSGAQRKLSALEEAFDRNPRLHPVVGDVKHPGNLLAAASDGVDVIFCGIYMTYDEKPDKVRQMLDAVETVSARTGAKVVLLEGAYRPSGVNAQTLRADPRYMRILVPELYGADVPNTIIHHSLKKIAHGKAVKLIADPAIRRQYLYAADAAQDVLELASQYSSFGQTWRLRGGPAVTEEALIGIAGSAVHAVPRIETIDGWKLRMLQWFEPGVKKMLDRYHQGDGVMQEPGTEYVGKGAASSYEKGIAATIEGMKEKNRQA